jgi:hypothetical protein
MVIVVRAGGAPTDSVNRPVIVTLCPTIALPAARNVIVEAVRSGS